MASDGAGMQRPRITVVIPTHGRGNSLRACLAALAKSAYPCERFDVLVVDDGSPEPVRPVVDGFLERMNVETLRQEQAGPAAARNACVGRGQGDFFAFTDDDCEPTPEWLPRLAEVLAADPSAGVGGHTVNALPGNRYSTASQLLIDHLYRYYNRDPERVVFLTSNNLAFPRSGFEAVGGFDQAFPRAAGEDRHLCLRWVEAGNRLRYEPRAVVRHSHRLGTRSFWRQHFGYGTGAFLLHRLQAERGGRAFRVESPLFYRDLLLCPVRELGWRRGLPQVPLMFLSQVAGAWGFAAEAIRHRGRRGRADAAGGG